MSKPLRWTIAILTLTSVAILLVWAFFEGRQEIARERERERPVKVPPRVSRGPAGEIIVTLDRQTQSRIFLQTQTLAAQTLRPEIVAYGRLQEDPSRSFTLRSPVAGILRPSSDREWPQIGDQLAAGVVAGMVEPRLVPVERVDLASRLAGARADIEAASASLAASRAAFERAKLLNADDKNVSDRAVEEAEARVKGDDARLRAANETARLLEASLAQASGPSAPLALRLDSPGEVVEVFAKPGESIEGGQAILRVARFDRLLARIDAPAGERPDPKLSTARLLPLTHDDTPLRAERVALGASIDPRFQGQPFLFRVTPQGFPLRPGESVKAYLPAPGRSERGVIIPRSAIVRLAGRAWAYLQIADDRFSRREIALDRPTQSGWFAASGFNPGDRVVTSGAQTLLSEEFKSQIQLGEEEESGP